MQLENVEDIYQLSPMQQGMLFHTLYDQGQGTSAYFQQIIFTLHAALDVTVFQRAWQQVVDRHPALRTAFLWQSLDTPLQVVRQHAQMPWTEYDWREESPPQQRALLDVLLEEQRQRGFDLDQSPLMNCALARVAEDTYWFVWNHHHLILDAWSTSIVIGEVFTLYDTFRRGLPAALDAPTPYREYIAWLQQQDLALAATFWQQRLQGVSAPTPLPGDKPAKRAADQQESWGDQPLVLPAALTADLRSLAQREHLTLNTLVQGAWGLLLSRYSGQDDVIFGVTTSGRPATLPGVEGMVGLFINTLPLRMQVPCDADLIPWLRAIQAGQVQQEQYAYSPLVEVQRWSSISPPTPLFESLLVFENAPANSAAQIERGNLTISDIQYNGRTNYPLVLQAVPGPELLLNLQYDANHFDSASIVRMLGHLQTMLGAIAANPRRRLGAIPWMTKAERHQIVVTWNATEAAYPATQCLHHLFEAQAAKTPEHVALIFEGSTMTYAELDRRANMLAHRLCKHGVGPEVLVGVYMERSPELIVALLGILKAGGAYVPLDPSYPVERLQYMLVDAQVSVLLTNREIGDLRLEISQPRQSPISNLQLDADWEQIAQEPTENPDSGVRPENLAYMIYTSGSTGRPKGVQIPHAAVVNLLAAMAERPGLREQDVLLAVTTLSFDIAALELFLPLVKGARVVLAPRDVAADGQRLGRLLSASGATVMQATPATWRMLIAHGELSAPKLRALCGGEALPHDLARQLIERCGELWNMYGPTETTIWSATGRVCADSGGITIGSPIANTRMYILDRQLQPLPVGVPGDLYIGGDGLARGYGGLPDLTAERFVPNPFLKIEDRGLKIEDSQEGAQEKLSAILYPLSSTRLYRTGDLARYLQDGSIEYLGRTDDQVKLRGYRIELGEIEATLLQHALVGAAVVMVREDTPGEQRLVAYVVEGSGARVQGPGEQIPDPRSPIPDPRSLVPDLRAFLKDRLPDYMIPAAFVVLDALPLTPNGKIDRRALAAPSTARPEQEQGFIAPRTFVEEQLAALWSELLQIDQVGVEDNFFVLGGHSLLLMGLASRIQETFEVDVPLRVLFDNPTVTEISRAITERLVEKVDPEEFDELLDEIHALSPDELQALLQAETE